VGKDAAAAGGEGGGGAGEQRARAEKFGRGRENRGGAEARRG